MADKLVLSDLTNLQNESSATNIINSNSEKIEDAIQNTLSRDGTSPNAMGATLDMNSNRIINLPEPVGAAEPVRKDAFDALEAATVTVAAEAAASAAAALVSENNAEAAEIATEALLDEFDDIYLGAKASAPVVDNDGDVLATGALYFNTGDDLMYTWDGAGWVVTFNPSSSAVDSVFGRTGAVAASNGDYTASQVTNVAAGNISSITVQTAINELDTEKQPVDATLTALAGVTVAADKVIYATGADAFATTDLPAFGRTLIANASAADARTDLVLVVGTDVQAYDAELAALAGLTSAADKVPYFTGSGTAAVADLTAAARTILDDANVDAIRTTLGVGTGDTPSFTGVTVGTSGVLSAGTIELGHASNTTISRPGAGDIAVEGNLLYRAGGTDVPLADGGTGASLTDPNMDRIMAWDDSAGSVAFIALTDLTDEPVPAAGDFILAYGAEGDLRRVDWGDLPGAAGGIGNVVEDLTPQLGGDLDTNSNFILVDDAHGILDESSNEQLIFQTTVSAVNYLELTNSATGVGVTVGATGSDAAVDLLLTSKGAGLVRINAVPQYPDVPQNSQSTAYTLVLTDAQKHILHPTADNNARTFTIPANASVAYPIGTAITFINQINTVTIAITSDTLTLAGAGSTGSRTLAVNGWATALKVGTTAWVISGVGLT